MPEFKKLAKLEDELREHADRIGGRAGWLLREAAQLCDCRQLEVDNSRANARRCSDLVHVEQVERRNAEKRAGIRVCARDRCCACGGTGLKPDWHRWVATPSSEPVAARHPNLDKLDAVVAAFNELHGELVGIPELQEAWTRLFDAIDALREPVVPESS